MLWQSAILIVIVTAADFVLRKWAWPQVRYALWLLILVKLVLPPSLTSPASFTAEIPFVVQQTIQNTEKVENSKIEYLNPPFGQIQNTEMDSRLRGNDRGEILPRGLKPTLQVQSPENLLSWKVYALCVWMFGVFILTLWLVLRLHALRKEHLRGGAKLPTGLEELLQSTAQKVGLKNVPQIISTNKICCPAVFGVFKPVLLLPANKLKDMSTQDVEHIFLHELSHIKRGDLLVHAAYMILQIAYWFNPLLWIIRKHIQNLRELCCDAAVARILKEKTAAYRETLLETARRLVAEPVDPGLGLLGLFENSGRLIDRLRWLEKKSWKYRGLRIATVFILICVMSACVLPMTKFEAKADFVVKGRVTDAQTAEPIANAKVGDVNEYADGKFFAVTDSNGDYSYQTYYEEHNIKCTAAGYKSKNETLLTKFFGSEKEKVMDFQLAAEKNAATKTQSHENNKSNLAAEKNNFSAKLSNDATIELVGICTYPSNGKKWWKPDGTPLGYDIETKDINKYESKDPAYEFVFKPLGAGHYGIVEIQRAVTWLTICVVKPDECMFAIRSHFKKNVNTTNIKAKFVRYDAKWETVAAHNGKGATVKYYKGKKIMFSQANDSGDGVIITVADNLSYENAHRLIAKTKDGKDVSVDLQTSLGVDGMYQQTLVIKDTKKADIKSYQFQITPYESVTFKNISLKPKF
jgi:beta-lactamase regulating signal transducer with metallopeptidase domain/CRISPR/Cas system CMR-associated protein Cmr5 small subunit